MEAGRLHMTLGFPYQCSLHSFMSSVVVIHSLSEHHAAVPDIRTPASLSHATMAHRSYPARLGIQLGVLNYLQQLQ